MEVLTKADYLMAIGQIVGPKNIISISKISNQRVCLYLKSMQIVETLTTNHSIVTIKDHTVDIRKYVTPAKRIIFSNVALHIPNEPLKEVIKNIGLKAVSPISILRAGLGGDYSHVLSHRRQTSICTTR